MKKTKALHLIALLGTFFTFSTKIYCQTTHPKTEIKMESAQLTQKNDTAVQYLIDKFFVPADAIQEFTQRLNINRNFIKTLPDFIEDNVYMRTDENGNQLYVTIAVWKNQEAVKKAFREVQALYKEEGFDMQSFLKRLNIVIDRGVNFKKITN